MEYLSDFFFYQWPPTCISGHVTSSRAIHVFLVITFDWDEIQTSNQLQSVCIIETSRLICNMTWSIGSGHDLDLRSNLRNDLLGKIIYHSTRLDKIKTMVLHSFFYLYGIKSYFRKNYFRPDRPFWLSMTSRGQTVDHSSNLMAR